MEKKWYRVSFEVMGERWAYVEAESKEEAEDLAFDKVGFGYLCHQCSENIDVSEEPFNEILVEEAVEPYGRRWS